MALNLEQIKQLDFEGAYKRLGETTNQLELGNLSLEESLSLYEEGIALAQHCGTLLDQAELRISQITPGVSNPFED
ncbi:MAG: exodeoxyribonuclease VII small subunit [Chloroflexota bacterium]|nr:exodeoxyribonuclease VII small subunit [Chloroflexota bacterium]